MVSSNTLDCYYSMLMHTVKIDIVVDSCYKLDRKIKLADREMKK